MTSGESVESPKDSAGEINPVVTQTVSPAEEAPTDVTSAAQEIVIVSSNSSNSSAEGPDSVTSTPTPECPEPSNTQTIPGSPAVEYSPDTTEIVAKTETVIQHPRIDILDKEPITPTPALKEETPAIMQLRKESLHPVVPTNLQGPLYKPAHEVNPSHASRGKGSIETIEEICQKSLEGINLLLNKSNGRYTEEIRQLESDKTLLKKELQDLASERDALTMHCNNWDQAYKILDAQLKDSVPYLRIFSHSLPAWLSLEKLASLLKLPPEDGTEFKIDPKIVWRILPAYISLVDELKSGTLAPRQLTSACDAFSEAVCTLFEGDDQQVTDWHENANEYLKPAGYSFMILAVGTQIDNALVTGSIQGKATIGTIKRMALIKDSGDVIRKADVTGV